MAIMSSFNDFNNDFQGKFCRDNTPRIVLDNFIQECKSKLIFSAESPDLGNRFFRKYRSESLENELSELFIGNSLSADQADIQFICRKTLKRLLQARIDFASVENLLENIAVNEEHFILKSLMKLLWLTIEYKYKNKRKSNKKMMKLLVKASESLNKDLQKEDTENVEIIAADGYDQNNRDQFNLIEIANLIRKQTNSRFNQLQPTNFPDKISLCTCEFDSDEIDDLLNEI